MAMVLIATVRMGDDDDDEEETEVMGVLAVVGRTLGSPQDHVPMWTWRTTHDDTLETRDAWSPPPM